MLGKHQGKKSHLGWKSQIKILKGNDGWDYDEHISYSYLVSEGDRRERYFFLRGREKEGLTCTMVAMLALLIGRREKVWRGGMGWMKLGKSTEFSVVSYGR